MRAGLELVGMLDVMSGARSLPEEGAGQVAPRAWDGAYAMFLGVLGSMSAT